MLDVTPYMLVEAYTSVYDQEPVNEDYEILAGYLFDEGLAESYDDVDSIIEELDDEELESILDEVWGRGKIDPSYGTFTRDREFNRQEAGQPAMKRTPVQKMEDKLARTKALGNPKNERRIRKIGTALRRAGDELSQGHTQVRLAKERTHRFKQRRERELEAQTKNESFDSYDLVLDYLLDEGYAGTEAGALTIMSNMSEEWVDAILDEAGTIRSVTRNGKTVYKRSRGQDRQELDVAIGKWSKGVSDAYGKRNDPNEAEDSLENARRKSISRLNAKSNSKQSERGLQILSPGGSHYSEVPTDYRARRRRASGR
jgi:hypothetical protein